MCYFALLSVDFYVDFHMLTQELSPGSRFWKSGFKERLQLMFPNSVDEKVDGVKLFTESYHKYKWNYVRHLGFNPQEDNLSKCNLKGKLGEIFLSAESFNQP